MLQKKTAVDYIPYRYFTYTYGFIHALTKVCCTGLIPCKKWIWCSGLMQIKYILALGEPPTCSFYLKSFCTKYYCNFQTDWGEFEVSLTDSFPLSHITNHSLSTYPVFKAIFSPDGRNVACIKVTHTDPVAWMKAPVLPSALRCIYL